MLFYCMGDFFELFFDDAKIARVVLDIALTARGEHDGGKIPMCGVPAHSAEGYLAGGGLIKGGHRVAIADQIETPEQAKKGGGSKALSRAPSWDWSTVCSAAAALPTISHAGARPSMVEMVETAAILAQATPRSLVILTLYRLKGLVN